jgi:hypothetical protein
MKRLWFGGQGANYFSELRALRMDSDLLKQGCYKMHGFGSAQARGLKVV